MKFKNNFYLILFFISIAILSCSAFSNVTDVKAEENTNSEIVITEENKKANENTTTTEINTKQKETETIKEKEENKEIQAKEIEPQIYFNPDFEIGQITKNDSKKVIKNACNIEYVGNFRLSFYCPCVKCCNKDPSSKWYGITATETTATEGRTIAVDPRYIPYGTKVYIEGYGLFVAEDCGGAIKNERIDIFLNNHKICFEFGLDYRDVYIVHDFPINNK